MSGEAAARPQCDSCVRRCTRGGMILPAVPACSWIEDLIGPESIGLQALMQVTAEFASERQRCPGYLQADMLRDSYRSEDLPPADR